MIAVKANTTPSAAASGVCLCLLCTVLIPHKRSSSHNRTPAETSDGFQLQSPPYAPRTVHPTGSLSPPPIFPLPDISSPVNTKHDYRSTETYFPTVLPYVPRANPSLPVAQTSLGLQVALAPLHCPCSLLRLATHVSRSLYLPQSCHTLALHLITITYRVGCVPTRPSSMVVRLSGHVMFESSHRFQHHLIR